MLSTPTNTNLVKKAELPKSYEDFLDPKWKGRLGIEAEDVDWFAMVVKEIGEDKGLKLFRDIVARNGLSVRRGTRCSPAWSPRARCLSRSPSTTITRKS